MARVEAGYNLDSPVAKRHNNFIGMGCVVSRPTTATGCEGSYAVYPSMEECVKDIQNWMDVNPQLPSEPFHEYLKRRNYNPYPTYYSYVQNVSSAF